MNKKNKVLLSCVLLSSISLTVLAAPIIQESVTAYFKSNLQYELNGEEVMKGKGGIVYNDKVYVPLRDTAELLGANVEYKNDTVVITKKVKHSVETPQVVAPTVFKLVGVVKEINSNSFVLTSNNKDYVVNTTNKTIFSHQNNKEKYNIKDLKKEQKVEINYNETIDDLKENEVFANLVILVDNNK